MKPQTQAADGLINEMEGNDPETLSNTVDGGIVQPGATNNNDRSPRRRAMFFEKVGEKSPPFGKTLFLYKVMNSKDYFTTGRLSSITELEHGFSYRFTDDQDGITDAHEFTFWLLPQLP